MTSSSKPTQFETYQETLRFEEERVRMHREMLSSVSHDLKTPLASVIGSLEIYERLKNKLSPDKQATLIATALEEAYRLDTFISNILDMARLENGLVRARGEAGELSRLIKDCLMRLGHRLQDCEIRLHGPDGEVPFNTDHTLLCRTICLVLENARKYSGPHPIITIDYFSENGHPTIRITDNGPGIPFEQREAVFSKYTRLQKQDRQTAGTGLGLAICKEIMRLLGGTISVACLPEGGAAFSLMLPKEQKASVNGKNEDLQIDHPV